MKHFKVGVDSYSIKSLNLSPFETLDWVKKNDGDGVQFTELNLRDGQRVDPPFLRDLAQYAEERGLYLEWSGGQHIPFDTTNWKPIKLEEINRKAAEQAKTLGVKIIRSCSGGLMRWQADSPMTETLIDEMARNLKKQKSMLEDFGVCLALELHFEFTTFELLKLFEKCDAEPGGYLGICLDTMNVLTMLEDPVMATERVLPWVVATHAKDGGILLNEQGLVSFTAEAGTGVVNWEKVLNRLATLQQDVTLSVEDHGGTFDVPIFDLTFLSKFPDVTPLELSRLLQHTRMTQKLMEQGTLKPVDRADWGHHCEPRVKNGIKNMKNIVEELNYQRQK